MVKAFLIEILIASYYIVVHANEDLAKRIELLELQCSELEDAIAILTNAGKELPEVGIWSWLVRVFIDWALLPQFVFEILSFLFTFFDMIYKRLV